MESTTNHRISLRGSLGPVIFPHGNFGSKVPGSSLSPPTKLLWSIIQMFDCKIQIRSQECKNLFSRGFVLRYIKGILWSSRFSGDVNIIKQTIKREERMSSHRFCLGQDLIPSIWVNIWQILSTFYNCISSVY